VLSAAEETESTQENIQDWLQLDGDPGFQLLTDKEIAEVIFFYLFSSALCILLHFPLIRYYYIFHLFVS
jgi:hypothetical protein